MAALLHETAEHHVSFEAVAEPHDWWDWYAAYLDARQLGRTSEEAATVTGRYLAEVKHEHRSSRGTRLGSGRRSVSQGER